MCGHVIRGRWGSGVAMVPKTTKKPVDGEAVIKNSSGSQPQIEGNNIIITLQFQVLLVKRTMWPNASI
jgi:hypothetical protein